MHIVSIEPTPSPNTMKLNMSEELPSGKRNNYTKENQNEAPTFIQELLKIDGIKGVYHVMDFIALERNPRYDWKELLPQARSVFGERKKKPEEKIDQGPQQEDAFGEVKVFFQVFRGIPMQVKLSDGEQEKRVGLPERFMNAAIEAQKSSDNVVMERKWAEKGVRYGSLEEIGEQIVEELSASYDEQRLKDLVNQAISKEEKVSTSKNERAKVTISMFAQDDWSKRYALLEKINPTLDDLPLLKVAVKDDKASIRRLAVVYLGMLEDEQVLPYLYDAVLHDSSVTVRRTAGDCLSDIGSPKAIPTMIEALKDKNKLVRWRAAMFLYEVGDESAIKGLKEAQEDPEFEVSMQIKLALKRIEGGKEAEGSVWKQMTETISKKK